MILWMRYKRMNREYPANLATLPPEGRERIEQDKKAWLKAHTMLKNWQRSSIKKYLDNLSASARSDLARRLNTIEANKKRGI